MTENEGFGGTAPVLVVGAGPVGLTTAILLAVRGVRPLVVERHPGTSIHPRARGISGAAMRVFGEAGVAGQVREAGRVLARNTLLLTVDTLAGAELDRQTMGSVLTEDEHAAFAGGGFTLCPQDLLEPVLLARARALGVEVRFGTDLAGLTMDATGVSATLVRRAAGERYGVRAGFVVGADGTHGPVRRLAGIGAYGPGRLGRHVSILFRADLADLVRGREFLFCFAKTAVSPGFFAAIDNVSRWQFTVTLADGDAEADFTADRCRDLVRAAVGRADLDVEIEHVLRWYPALRVAESLHRGRVALAGDAAHELPAGGLGTGVQDAAVLAPYLIEALAAGDAADPLAPYTQARLPVVEEIAERIHANAGPSGLPK